MGMIMNWGFSEGALQTSIGEAAKGKKWKKLEWGLKQNGKTHDFALKLEFCRVGRLVDEYQIVDVQMSVAFGGDDTAVAQDLLDDSQIRTVF